MPARARVARGTARDRQPYCRKEKAIMRRRTREFCYAWTHSFPIREIGAALETRCLHCRVSALGPGQGVALHDPHLTRQAAAGQCDSSILWHVSVILITSPCVQHPRAEPAHPQFDAAHARLARVEGV